MSQPLDLPQPLFRIDAEEQKRLNAPSIALLESWLRRSKLPASREQIAEAEADLIDFMRHMNAPRRETGERLNFPTDQT